jgi:hypothetical protein
MMPLGGMLGSAILHEHAYRRPSYVRRAYTVAVMSATRKFQASTNYSNGSNFM